MTERRRPGLAKARRTPLVSSLHAARVRAADVRWRELLDVADAISEGATRREAEGDVWYGSTSLVLLLPETTDDERAFLAAVAEHDVHVRVRVLRLACREATLRAPSILGRAACEIRVQPDARGLRIDVDLQAPLIARAAAAGP